MIFATLVYAADTPTHKIPILTQSQQERANHLYEIVRCPVCSGQSLAGSEASIAQDLRTIIHQKIAENFSDDQIKQYLVSLYGEDILFEPPINRETFLLNYGAYGILLIILSIFLYHHHHRSKTKAQGHNTNHGDND
jgi:cytochrome c-type biogenesis protein CcmH